jgi:serine/threonine-protein kinase
VFTPDGRLSLVTELMVGESLEDALTARDAAGVRFSLEDLRFVFEPLVSTIALAHENHIVHRDLKPGNVFLDRRDGTVRVRLMDFGFARLTRLTRLTAAGFVAGSPSYIAPEVWLDQPATELSDVYALGAMMFRALGGRPPFESANMVEVYLAATNGPRPSLAALRPDLPRGIDDWVAQALAIRPSDRFWTPAATYQALAGTLGGG